MSHRHLGNSSTEIRAGQWEWDAARAIGRQLELTGHWDAVTHAPATEEAPTERPTKPNAIDAFLAGCKNWTIQPTTLAKYKTFTNQLRRFCDHRGYAKKPAIWSLGKCAPGSRIAFSKCFSLHEQVYESVITSASFRKKCLSN
jgi:hypothetical protein